MNSTLAILLIEPSFLLREGLKNLFSQMGLSFRVDETDLPVTHFIRLIERTQPRLVIVNPVLLQQVTLNRTDVALSGITIVGIVNENTPPSIAGQFDAVISCNAGRAELAGKFEEILRKGRLIEDLQSDQQLSERETEILRLVALGLTNIEISEKLFISVHTVMTHRKNITRKLGIKTVSGLTVYAILNKLIMAEELKGGKSSNALRTFSD
ncbi:MAG TPA: response regulator transcription factor [Bacteroidales bacterium]|nr:response regulator transcription factor [Bacteroidales bacterium]